MGGNKPRFDHQQMMADYLSGASLRECAARYGVSMQACHRIIKLKKPRIMRKPHVWQKRAA